MQCVFTVYPAFEAVQSFVASNSSPFAALAERLHKYLTTHESKLMFEAKGFKWTLAKYQ